MNILKILEADTSKKKKDNSSIRSVIKSTKAAVVGIMNRFSSNGGSDPGSRNYDLAKIKNAIITDSYLAVSIRKFSQLIAKGGYQLKSKNEDAADYLKKRIHIIEYRSKIPFDTLITSIARDLCSFSNSYIIKTRDNNLSKFELEGESIFPGGTISGLFLSDPCNTKIVRDDDGYISHYEVGNKEYPAQDVVHIYIDKNNNSDYGTSRIYPILEDLTMLRKAEGLVMSILYRFAMPILQIKVGNVAEGQYATDKEINEAKEAFENLSNDGFIVTNERTEIKSITPDMQANQLLNFLQYAENRVFTGLNTSISIMGRGGTQKSADNTDVQMHDEIKFLQKTISSFLEKYLFSEILMEGGFNPLIERDDYVHFTFNEINVDTKIKSESHTIQKYQGNVISLAEARRELGFDNEVKEEDMYAFAVTHKSKEELIDAQADATIKVAKYQNSVQSDTSSEDKTNLDERKFNGKKKDIKPNKFFKNDAQPENQNTKNVKLSESLEDNLASFEENFPTIYGSYKNLSNILPEFSPSVFVDAETDLVNALLKDLTPFAENGIENYIANNITNTNQTAELDFSEIEAHASETIHKILSDLQDRLSNNQDTVYIESLLSKMEYRIRFMADMMGKKAYWSHYISQAKLDGVKTINIDFGESEHQNGRYTHLATDNIKFEDIPAYSPYCKCGIKHILKG